MIHPRLQVPERYVDQVRILSEKGSELEQIIAYLQSTGLEAPRAKIALVSAGVASPNEAKRAIHASPAYSYRRSVDEAFEEAALKALDQLRKEEHERNAA